MGSLIVPSEGAAYLDANCIIYRVEQIEPYLSKMLPVFNAAKSGQISLVTSELTLIECLVAPIRKQDSDLEDRGPFRALSLSGITNHSDFHRDFGAGHSDSR